MSTPSISSSVSYFGKRIACNTIWLIERTLGNAIRKSCLVCWERPSRDFSTTRSHPQPWLSWINIVMLCNVKPCDRCNKGWNVQFVIPLLGIHCNYMHCKKPRGQLNGPSFSILLQRTCYILILHVYDKYDLKRELLISTSVANFPLFRLIQTCTVHLKKICILHKLDSFYMKGRKGSRLSKFTHFLFIYLFFGGKGGGGTTYEESEK